jgi:predicted DNA-binding protein
MMRLAFGEHVATFRCPPGLQLQLEQLADATGYSKSNIIRKLLQGALLRLEAQAESSHDLVLALNRFSRIN